MVKVKTSIDKQIFKMIFGSIFAIFIVLTSIMIYFVNVQNQQDLDRKSKRILDRIQSNASIISENVKALSNVAFATRDFSSVNEILYKITAEDNDLQIISLVSEDGTILASSDEQSVFSKLDHQIKSKGLGELLFVTESGSEVVDVKLKEMQGMPGYFEYTYGLEHSEINYFIVLRYSSKNYAQEISLVEKDHKKKQFYLFLAGTFAVLVFLVFTYFISRRIGDRITKPILTLTDIAKKLAAGSLDEEVIINADNEIQILADAFENMRISISSNIHLIQNINESLEQTIETRTRELKNANTALVHSSKMAALGVMSAGIAHEINNPLAIIRGYAEELNHMTERFPGLDEKYIARINKLQQRILKSVDRISSIINNVKLFGREAANGELSEFSLVKLIEELQFFLQAQLQKNSVQLKVDIERGTPMIYGSKANLLSVLQNLLQNSNDELKNKEGSRLIEIKAYSKENKLFIEVKDNAGGIPEDIQDKIFDPFFTTKDIGKGTGLGLSLCYSIVEDFGGKLSFTSVPGEGTTFLLYIDETNLVSSYEVA